MEIGKIVYVFFCVCAYKFYGFDYLFKRLTSEPVFIENFINFFFLSLDFITKCKVAVCVCAADGMIFFIQNFLLGKQILKF